jgi:hypothetical protein
MIRPATLSNGCHKQNSTIKRYPGQVYKSKSNSEYFSLGISTPVLPDEMRGYMVRGVLRKLSYAKVIIVRA